MITRVQKVLFLVLAAAIAGILLMVGSARVTAQDDISATYKSKCVACHGAAAEKKFDAAKPEDELIQTTLKGRKMEKPPNMPAYEEKGITAEQAKALVAFMKSLKQ